MSNKKLSQALGNIGEGYINEAADFAAKKKKISPWLKWSSVAACFAIMLVAALIITPSILGDEYEGSKYYDYGINDGIFSSYIGANVISNEKIGNKLENVKVTAGWKNEEGEWLDNKVLNAELYEIKGVNSNEAVALKFIDGDEAVSTDDYYVIMHPNTQYNGMLFPDYKTENPVRYLDETPMGKSNGWQDFGTNGEIRTITVPMGSTYVYQMYSYYIRNDLSHIYLKKELPAKLEDLPQWLTDTVTVGRRSFWYSMGRRIPDSITLGATASITSENGDMQFIKAEYKVQIKDGSNIKEEDWVIYFMEENGVYSAYAVKANENFDFVKSYTETIVKSYQQKQ